MDHSHSNYFLPFDAASYFDAAAASYNPYTEFYSHPQSTTSTSSTAGTASYHQMYRTPPTTFRPPTSFYSATMQSKYKTISFVDSRRVHSGLQSSYKMFGTPTNDANSSAFLTPAPTTSGVFLHDNKRKQRRIRTTFTSLQLRELEKCFQQVRVLSS